MNLLARAIIASAGASAPFSYADIPNQLLRINSLEGSLGFSGGTLTSVTDVSAVAGTVNVTGTPTYTAADAALNNAPSFTGGGIVAPNVNRASVAFVAAVLYREGAGNRFVWDGTAASGRHYLYFTTGGAIATHMGTLSGDGLSIARKRVLAALDGVTASLLNGASIGTYPANNASGSGITIASSYTGATPTRVAFLMLCSAVPDLATRAALETKLLEDFG